ncbi:uncharacterized protein LOC106062852 [Biomphalaria glabrata]|uniref:Uncharacterized protein LOC106062852 n=1 Tax=Biomphalaria glabrata TaxID=6526 RepID=A0A9U8E7L5_BIOGL|nr:uncharacterized protein LOC106062852 [Biomphalaria glabrata]
MAALPTVKSEFDVTTKNYCVKFKLNPDHHTYFKSKDNFSDACLPKHAKHQSIVELVESSFKLCVKLQISTIHTKYSRRLGSGWICGVNESGPDQYKIRIVTAKHVIGADFKKIIISVQLYFHRFDQGDIEKTDRNVELFASGQIESCGDDICCFECCSDLGTFNKIKQDLEKHLKSLNTFIKYNQYTRDKNKVCFLLSHPHGCICYVSIGERYIQNDDGSDDEDPNKEITYTIASCQGSSGGYVLYLGLNNVKTKRIHLKSRSLFSISSKPILENMILKSD